MPEGLLGLVPVALEAATLLWQLQRMSNYSAACSKGLCTCGSTAPSLKAKSVEVGMFALGNTAAYNRKRVGLLISVACDYHLVATVTGGLHAVLLLGRSNFL